MISRTPLYAAHLRRGGKMIEFGGWEMPVYYTSIMDEHQAVRRAAGVFDISHMGEFLVSGSAARNFLNFALTNDVNRLTPGQGHYTLMCNNNGGVIDDLYLYCLSQDQYLLIVNASRIEVDFAHLQSLHGNSPTNSNVALKNVSAEMGALAVQGPAVAAFIDACFSGGSVEGMAASAPNQLKKNQVAGFIADGVRSWVARTGYTGEDGFEIIAPAARVEEIWERILQTGAPHGVKPAGLGARDTLRTEMCYPLYGHELSETISPMEAGLGFFVALDKGDFLGCEALQRKKLEGTGRKLAAFRLIEKAAPPRPGYTIWSSGAESIQVGEVSSGTQSPSLGIGIGMGFVGSAFAKAETQVEIEARGKHARAVIIPKPIYRKPN